MAQPAIKSAISTSLQNGGVITVNSGDNTKFDISDGFGYKVVLGINNEPLIYKIEWSGQSGISATHISDGTNSFVAINDNGVVFQQLDPFTQEQDRTLIVLGKLIHIGGSIVATTPTPLTGYYSALRSADIMRAIGNMNIEGNIVSANGNNLKINCSAGKTLRRGSNYVNDPISPDITNDTALTTPSFEYTYRNGSGGFSRTTQSTDVDPTKYDDGTGTLATVGNNRWTIQRVYKFNSTNNIQMTMGQARYSNLQRATLGIINENYEENPALSDAVLIGYLVLKGNCTSLQQSRRASFVKAGRFGGGGGYQVQPTNENEDEGIKIKRVTSDYTVSKGDEMIIADATSSSVTITMPDPVDVEGQQFFVAAENTTVLRTVTVDAEESANFVSLLGSLVSSLLTGGTYKMWHLIAAEGAYRIIKE